MSKTVERLAGILAMVVAVSVTAEAGGLWTPAEITLLAWYDAADSATLTTNSAGEVSQWDDKSGNDRHLSQNTSSRQPQAGSRSINGIGVLDFQADFMDARTNLSISGDISVFAVFGFDSASSGNGAIWDLDNTVDGRLKMLASSTAAFSARLYVEFGPYSGRSATPPGTPYNDPAIFNGIANWTDQLFEVYVNGTNYNKNTNYNLAPFTSWSSIRIGSKAGNVQTVSGRYGEIIMTTDVTTETRQKLEGYLAWKWKLQDDLPEGHPYKTAPPVVQTPGTVLTIY